MQKNLSFYLVKKYLRFDKSQPFITVISLLAFFGVAIGLTVLMVAMAIMNGFDKEFEKKLFTMNYPLSIYSRSFSPVDQTQLNALQEQFPKLKFSPYISTQVIIKKGNRLEGGMLFGVNFEQEAKINAIVAEAIKGKTLDKYDLITGSEIAKTHLFAQDEKATLIFTKNDPGGMSLIPKMKRFNFQGSFRSGLMAYDKAYMYTTLDSLAQVMQYEVGQFDGIHIYSDEPFVDIEKIRKVLPDDLGIVGWWQMNGNFFAALALEKRALFIVLMLIILIASLNIISSLLMTVMNRRKEIALLLSLGAYKKEIKNTFFYLGLVIGGGGMLFGILLGGLALFVLGSFDIISLPADVYGTAKLPLDLSMLDFVLIVIGTSFIVTLSSYYPAHKATQINVLDTLRNE
ncbi:ABC transporter permease [Sulfurospirillum diekertiae]|uniref:ABC transporter permease n=1 Tax=Sulfurospirillum diekertiae TaxID=1854492 RepID=A0A290HT88_9BACT|nr:ABC transporter permease [Sulfurospirillum diekertiae]ATB69854.1 lipoprotein releasing system transmembrane protein LolC [Sulfurospirillum diekertiae]QIR74918.1 ABC transporter permease [Sulfurospirillum diekertiae]QIR77583.1 ABC transporter permease [Sulfurospirillum diekertiae]